MNKPQLFKAIAVYLKKHGAKQVSIFGSYAKNQENKKSDIDILVTFSKTKSLLELVSIEQQLESQIGKKIDLVTEKAISPYIIGKIKKELVKIY